MAQWISGNLLSTPIHRENGSSAAFALSLDMSGVPASASVTNVRLQVSVSLTRTKNNYVRIQNASDAGIEYLRERNSGTYTTSSIGSSRMSSVTLVFRADTGVYADFTDIRAIVDYTINYIATTGSDMVIEAGSSGTMTLYNPRLSELHHTVQAGFGIRQGELIQVPKGQSTVTVSIPIEWLDQFTGESSGYGGFIIATYDDSNNLVGQTVSNLRVDTPDSAGPQITGMVVSRTGTGRESGISLQGISGLDIQITATTQYAATIASVQFSAGTPDPENAYLAHIPSLTTPGNMTVTVTVTDSRGKTASRTSDPIYVYPYASPTVSEIALERCDAVGNVSDTGTYAQLTVTASYSPCTDESVDPAVNRNTLNIAAAYQDENGIWQDLGSLTSGTTVIVGNGQFSASRSYPVRVRAWDSFGGESIRTVLLGTADMIMFVNQAGTRVSFGMVAQHDGFEVRPDWEVWFYGQKLVDLLIPVGTVITVKTSEIENLPYPSIVTWTTVDVDGDYTRLVRTAPTPTPGTAEVEPDPGTEEPDDPTDPGETLDP